MVKVEDEDSRVCVLEFWTTFLSLSYGNNRVDRIKELLDGSDGLYLYIINYQ